MLCALLSLPGTEYSIIAKEKGTWPYDSIQARSKWMYYKVQPSSIKLIHVQSIEYLSSNIKRRILQHVSYHGVVVLVQVDIQEIQFQNKLLFFVPLSAKESYSNIKNFYTTYASIKSLIYFTCHLTCNFLLPVIHHYSRT